MPIVGIGASAGGLDALTRFFTKVPADSGMAFVVVQHLDPTQKDLLPALLQRITRLKVLPVADRTRVRPNHIYVIPPDCDLSLLHGTLHLLAPVAPRGLRLPIDSFFRSLAEDQRDNGIGIILSGMGSDGTLGLRAIKEKAGLTLVQEPSDAKFDAMPRSSIEAGLADFTAPAAQLPGKLLGYLRHRPRLPRLSSSLDEKSRGALEKIVILLRAHTGNDFTLYRRSTLERRVEHRMVIHRVTRLATYVRYLQENPQEVGILFKELLIGVTHFFRDPAAWEQLAKLALPALIKSHVSGGTFRAWIAGCSTGEEAYTLAILLTEALDKIRPSRSLSIQIYATDLDADAIDQARLGRFPASIAADVSPQRLARFFVKEPRGYRVNKELRARIIFAPQNLIMHPPFTKLDVLCCRNLLIYLTPELQRKIFPLFHYCLKPGGALLLGSAESIGGFGHLFSPLALKERLFRRNDSPPARTLIDFPSVFSAPAGTPAESPAPAKSPASLQSVADQFLQRRFAPPAVLVNPDGDILYISGHTGPYLEPAAGKANWNVLAMAREGLRYELSDAFQAVNRHKKPVHLRGLRLGPEPLAPAVDLLVEHLTEPRELDGLTLVLFSPVPPPDAPSAPAGKKSRADPARRDLQRQLLRSREEVQACRAEMQTSQEELKSMNEELQTTNEELQSTNEELTTSKEEMQSLNEELHTVNAELQTKLDELSGAHNDMKNLLNSTDIATVFLDNELCVRRFTLQAKTIIKFIASDIGRPITDLASDLLYPALVKDARQVLRTLHFTERSIATHDDRWFTVRIMPYRTMDNRIDGVVITFANITAAKNVETDLRKQHNQLTLRATRQGLALDHALGRQPRRKSKPAKKPKS